MKKIIFLIFLIIFFSKFYYAKTAFAAGDLEIRVNSLLISGNPVFIVNNMLPGDETQEIINVKNVGSVARMLSIKGLKVDGSLELPNLEDVLLIEITEIPPSGPPIVIYNSTKTLKDFL